MCVTVSILYSSGWDFKVSDCLNKVIVSTKSLLPLYFVQVSELERLKQAKAEQRRLKDKRERDLVIAVTDNAST